MQVRVVLVDINPKMIQAWRDTFEENPEVEIVQGSMLAQNVDAFVTPTNSRGSMDGGLDAVLKKHFGAVIENRVQQAIGRLYSGQMPVGHATCVPTQLQKPAWLISTPTMVSSSEDISDSMNVALACAAAFQAVHIQNMSQPGSIESVALPGLGANTGRVPAEICADLMWSGYNLFRRRAFDGFAQMRSALEAELGDLGPAVKTMKAQWVSQPVTGSIPVQNGQPKPDAKAPPSEKSEEEDFDDFG
jgi:O-acetyl-ADP-ribose deacetylase (regulator of RNase III)